MTQDDVSQVKQIIDCSFPIVYSYFAFHSLSEQGQVLVAETEGSVVGFAKFIDFQIGAKKHGCILWIAIHPSFRRKHIAATLTENATQRLKKDGANTVFASTQRRNIGALSVFRLQGFRRIGFLGLRRLFGFRVLQFYSAIWFAPGEVVLMHE